jgi:hypothetical protein
MATIRNARVELIRAQARIKTNARNRPDEFKKAGYRPSIAYANAAAFLHLSASGASESIVNNL